MATIDAAHTIDLARIGEAHGRRGTEMVDGSAHRHSIGFCLLTQLTRACTLEGLAIESAEMDVRASFPLESKYRIDDTSAACEQVTYTVDVKGDVEPERLRKELEWAESVCHVVRSLKEPVPVEMAL